MDMLKALLEPRLRLLAQEREINALRTEVAQLRAQVASMKTGMRRCISCDYRLAFNANLDRQAAVTTPAERPGKDGRRD